ncbi:uncharacterized protein BDZ99DRAFT_470052 [Mytilinidion resinicola]|uniref:FAD-binding FR-type domain-containing protein n=1 Tax=Mytilinidion resinicola TaxID=574789 RepID=A0A6A6Z7A6_9PEZI|nr:uncharacterized protein BDZ99DRAFT_470052 [Mytilinidion resinicola]KAF2816982.1 hypothetical protein BDZ99DRAFT_470052 [Mytilinidion resinicola]
MLPLSLALVALFWSQGLCDELKKNQVCVDAVFEAFGDLNFEGVGYGEYYVSICNNSLKANSIYATAKTYCKPEDIKPGFAMLSEYCENYGEVELLPMSDFADTLTESYISSMRVIDYGEVAETDNITTTVLLSRSYFLVSYRTITIWDFEMWSHHTYGFALYGFWGSVLLLAMINRFINFVFHKRQSRVGTDPEHNAPLPNASSNKLLVPVYAVRHWIRANIIVPAAFGSHHQRLYYWFTVPTRLEAIIVFSYWAISIIFSGINYRTFIGNLYWNNISPQVWRYVADRTGILSYANLSLIWMFSGRNNIFIWATGWNFSTFNIFHRHVARIATLQAIVHSIAWTVIYVDDGYYKEEFAEVWFLMGVVATVLMSCLLLFSSVWLRKKFYEVFLLIHIAFSIVVLVALFYHTTIFDGEYNPYLWPPVAIWAFDRFLRVVRLVACNISLRFGGKKLQHTKTIATYSKETNAIRLEIVPGSAFLKPNPGAHYFVYQPLSWKGYENHPFTMGAWTSASENDASAPTHSTSSNKIESEIVVSTSAVSSGSASASSNQDHPTTLTPGDISLIFWIRPFNGWTRRMRNECLKATDGVVTRSNILIEGPYGERAPMHNYETVLLIAGGTGIAAAVPYIQDHIRRSSPRQIDGQLTFSTRTRRVELIWTCRQAGLINNIANRELAPALARDDVHASLFCTRDSGATTLSSSAVSEISPVEDKEFSVTSPRECDVKIEHGRPDVRGAILQTARSISAEGSKAGKIAILVCGPAGMADEARAAVHTAMKEGCRSVEYIEEAFGW